MELTTWLFIILLPIALILGLLIGYFYKQMRIEREQRIKKELAEQILDEAKEKAQQIEIQARDEALNVLKKAEIENDRRRTEVNKEEDRMQKRREELDLRLDRLEKREQAVNKRQSSIDKRANEMEKLYTDEMEELQTNFPAHNCRSAETSCWQKLKRKPGRIWRASSARSRFEAREKGRNRPAS